MDSIIVVHENIHSLLVNKRLGFLLNMDFLKAYDRFWVNWYFFIKIIWPFGFCEQLIQLVNQCISTLKFYVLISGSPSSFFSASRGI